MQSISDAEKEELLYLRNKIKELEEENKDLKEQLIEFQDIEKPKYSKEDLRVKKDFNDISNEEIENQIVKLCSEIKKHRNELNGKCWFFGIKNLKFDYGEVWSSPSYWKALIKSNTVTERFCLFDFVFQKDIKACKICNEKIDVLNSLYNNFLNKLKKEYKLNN